MRKLATVRVIDEIQPIEGADKIAKARVGGWWVVVKTGEFAQGDMCVYFEIDSFLPLRPEFEFLLRGRKPRTMLYNGQDRTGIRLRTISLRGQLSQGLALPPSVLGIASPAVGMDCSEQLDVVRWEEPVSASIQGERAGEMPSVIPRTDEERIQNRLDVLTQHTIKRFYVTSKLDGTSVTYYRHNGHFGVCARNFELKPSQTNTVWNVARQHGLPENLPEGFAVQGELVGEAIQSNRLKLKGQDVFVFYVWDIAKAQYLELEAMKEFCARLGLRTVPIVNENFVLDHTLDELLKMADGPSPLNPHVPQEGLVFRLWGTPRKMSFKVISNAYLLQTGE